MKKLRSVLCMLLIMAVGFSFAGCFGGSGGNTPVKPKTPVASVTDVYAFSCMSTAELLGAMTPTTPVKKAAFAAADAPTETPVADPLKDQIAEVNKHLAMFEGMLTGKDPIDTTVVGNAIYKEVTYTSHMSIAVKKIDGTSDTYEFYFNESPLKKEATEEEPEVDPVTPVVLAGEAPAADPTPAPTPDPAPAPTDNVIDEEEREQEIETELTGIMVLGTVEYAITGMKEIETEVEDGQTESEFKITFTATDTVTGNTIKVVQTIEKEAGEEEQKFSFEMKDDKGVTVSKSVICMEVEGEEIEIELTIIEGAKTNSFMFEKEGEEIAINYTDADGKPAKCTVTIVKDATTGASTYQYKFADGDTLEEDRD